MSVPAFDRSRQVDPHPVARVAANAAGPWHADADQALGFCLLAAGRGRSREVAARFPAVCRAAIAAAADTGGEEGLPAAVSAVVTLLRSADRGLRRPGLAIDGSEAGDGLVVLVAVARERRLFLVLAGSGTRCLRQRSGGWESLAPLGQRRRPALGAHPRALIEVTSDPLDPGDLVVVVPDWDGSGEVGIAGDAPNIARALVHWAGAGAGAPVVTNEPYAALVAAPAGAPEVEVPVGTLERRREAGAARGSAAPDPGHPSLLRRAAIRQASEGAGGPRHFAGPPDPSEIDPDRGSVVVRAGHALRPASAGLVPADLVAADPAAAVLKPSPQLDAAPAPRGGRTWYRWVATGVVGLLVAAAATGLWQSAARRAQGPGAPAVAADQRRSQAGGAGSPHAAAGLGVGSPFAGALGEAEQESGMVGGPAGILAARTEPLASGVEVFLDDRALGAAPVMIESLAAGPHRVRFRGPEGTFWEEEVLVRPGEVTEAVAPFEKAAEEAVVLVRTSSISNDGLEDEQGDVVSIDGVVRGKTPVELRVAPGAHTIRVRRAGMDPIDRVVDLRRGDRSIVDVRVDRTPTVAIEHSAPREVKAGETVLLSAVARGLKPGLHPLEIHVQRNGSWTHLGMATVPGAPGTYVIGLPLVPGDKGSLSYYFTAADETGEKVYTPILTVPVR